MAKIVLSLDDNLIKEYELDGKEVTIGRRSSNDVQIQNLAVSGKHARILTIEDEPFLEDLNSTNGTYINGRLVKKQALKDNDEIIIGKYKLVFQTSNEQQKPGTPSQLHTKNGGLSLAENSSSQLKENTGQKSESKSSAIIEVKNGAKAGQILPIQKPVTTLGRPGIQIAAIMKKPEGYFFMHIESEEGATIPPQHNKKDLGEDPVLLTSGDSLTVAGIHVEFMLS